jgi:hypothetical protein
MGSIADLGPAGNDVRIEMPKREILKLDVQGEGEGTNGSANRVSDAFLPGKGSQTIVNSGVPSARWSSPPSKKPIVLLREGAERGPGRE